MTRRIVIARGRKRIARGLRHEDIQEESPAHQWKYYFDMLETSPSANYRLAVLMRRFTYAVIEGDGVDNHEPIEVVLVRHIIAMPRDHIEGTVTLAGHEQCSLIFAYDLVIDLTILVPCNRRLEVSRIRQAICSCAWSPLIKSFIMETPIQRSRKRNSTV